MAKLFEAVEKKKSRVIRDLINLGFTKNEDGRQLHELSLMELEDIYNFMLESQENE